MTRESQRLLRKSSQVFWVQVQEEILLRNYASNSAVQLGRAQRAVWELLDGSHTADQIVERLASEPNCQLRIDEVHDLIASLESSGFLTRA